LNIKKNHLGGCMRQQTTLNSSGWLSSFVRSSHVGALIALFFSIMLTACGSERTIISEEPGPDGVAPELTLVKIYNGFNKGSEVKLGQTIMVEIEASESIMKPTIIIDGVAATVSGQHHEWTAEYTMDDESREDGPVPFKISFVDVSGVSGVDVEVSTEGDPLQYCKEGCASGDAAPGIVGDWKLAPIAGALGVGPVQGDISWWSSSEITLVDRDCLWDDIFRFNADGSFENVMGDLTFTEDWQNGGQGEVCLAPVAPHDGSNAATYVFDDGAYTLSLDGVGAHLGLPKAVNDAELTSPGDAPASIIYTVSAFNDSAMTLDINFGPGFWRFELVKVAGSGGAAASSDSILVGDWKMAPEAGALGVGPGQGDTSWWSNSATDLEDRACFFDDIFRFNADGSFENVMGDQTWLEAWQGVDADGCGALVAPHDGSNAATYNYIEAANTLKISGVGAHLGLAKVYNEAELSNPVDAPASISYTVTALNATEMTLDIEIQGGAYWRFKLVKI
jgi:hypothetical protein